MSTNLTLIPEGDLRIGVLPSDREGDDATPPGAFSPAPGEPRVLDIEGVRAALLLWAWMSSLGHAWTPVSAGRVAA
ncbi:hypothetical protein ABZW18_00625 [Streptomyces sp. NPDC004647]|uniref:hypothetical protein n=1 Tax=Streptomyces sp. NPDC004647 TaxID=3154671 RepID=UPI0033B9D01D